MSRPLVLLFTLAACDREPDGPTFYADVEPILEAECVSCHVEGGIGEMSLVTYDEAYEWSESIALAVRTRQMPPWAAVADGTCGDFHEPRWLTDAQVDTLVTWADNGAPAGDEADAVDVDPRPLPELLDPVAGTTPEFVPEVVGGSFAENDEYRCFPLDFGGTPAGFLTGYDVLPGNEAIVHHVIVSVVDPNASSYVNGKSNAEQMASLDDDDDRLGWPCFTGAGDGVRYRSEPVAWAPGQGAVRFPADSGVRVNDGDVLIAQVHYNLSDPDHIGESDSTTVLFDVAESVVNEAWIALPDRFLESIFTGSPDQIPPGEEAFVVDWTVSATRILEEGGHSWSTAARAEIWAVLPHMHERGQTISMERVRGEDDTCVVDVSRWDFGWQRMYVYDTPVELLQGDRLSVECVYDTTDDTEPVLPGWGTQNEMCLVGIYAIIPSDAR